MNNNLKMEIDAKIKIEISKEDLCAAISNALFCEFTINKNRKKISEMDLYQLANYIPEIIANEIINDIKDIIKF